MPLAQSSLATKIKAEIQAQFGGPPQDAAQLDKFAQAIAKAVVDELTQNAVVTSTGTVTGGGSSSGAATTSVGTIT